MKNTINRMMDAIGARYDDRSYYERLAVLVRGLNAPRTSKDHKEAIIELQRLSAPVSALLVPLLLVLLLIIFTQRTDGRQNTAVQVEVLTETPPPEELRELPAEAPQPASESVADMAIPVPMAAVETDVGVQPVASPVKLTSIAAAPLRRSGIVLPKGALGRWGTGSSFGSTNQYGGDLVGTMYDFKRDASGEPRAVNYWEDLRGIVGARLSPQSFKPFYKVPKQVYLSHLFVPFAPAETAPEAFGVGKLMEARGWVAHYSGEVQPMSAGTYRFVGVFDNVIIVLIDGQTVLEFTWGNQAKISGWEPTENVGAHRSYIGSQALVYGDWIDFRPDRAKRIDILVGERPGGMVGGVLLIQKKDVTYATEANGRPILPIFATSLLSPQERQQMSEFKEMAFDSHTPVMKRSGSQADHAIQFSQDQDIRVNSGNL